MKSWKVILWLFAFYPIGIYNMFKHTNWPKGIKYTITVILSLITLMTISIGELLGMLMISGTIVFLMGLISIASNIFKKKDKKASLATLFIGILLLTYSYPKVEQQLAIEEKQQQELVEKQEKEEQLALLSEATIAVEAAEKDKNRTNYKKADELLKKLKPKNPSLAERLTVIDTYLTKEEKIEEATLAIEKAEKDKTQKNYEAAASLMATIDLKGTNLEERLANVKEFIDTEKEKTDKAIAALEEAEENNKRESYDKAHSLVSELSVPDKKLSARLSKVETIVIAEEEKIAAEKAEQDKINAEKAEEERIAAEKAEQDKINAKKAEDARIAAEKAEQDKINAKKAEEEKVANKGGQGLTGGSNKSSTSSTPSTPAPSTPAPSIPAGGNVSSIDTNGNGNVTIPEAKAAGFSMPITSDHWLYPYMDDRDNDGMVGE